MKNNILFIFFFLAIGLVIFRCATQSEIDQLRAIYSSGDPDTWPEPEVDSTVLTVGFEDIGPLGDVPFPEDNPYTKEKAALGKLLFFDPRLSKSGQIACATCHDPELAWGDGRRVSYGHDRKTGNRNAMTLLNVGFATSLFWDGRAKSLEDQSQFPISNELEMNEKHEYAVEKIAAIKGYDSLFTKVFGDNEVTLPRIQQAIATFERTIKSVPSRFDLFVQGKSDKLTDSEVLGLHLFRTKARCINCHNTPYFSDNRFHNDGQTLWGSRHEDLGLYNITGKLEDVGKFRTPTLRETAHTGPWMHHGNFPTLLDVVQYYNLGNPDPIQDKYLGTPRDSLIPEKSAILRELKLADNEIQAIIDFLGCISTTPRRLAPPKLPQ